MTPLQLQSIVDNQCSPADRARTLASMNDDLASWKTLALALLEEQQWAAAIKADVASAPTEIGRGEGRPVAAVMASDRGSLAIGDHRRSARRFRGYGHLLSALAASVLLAFGFAGGMFLRQIQSPSEVGIALPNEVVIDSSLGSTGENELMKMVVDGPNSTGREIPVYDLNRVSSDALFAQGMREFQELESIRRKMRSRGFEIEMQPEYYTGQLSDGRRVVVPIRQVGLRPIGL